MTDTVVQRGRYGETMTSNSRDGDPVAADQAELGETPNKAPEVLSRAPHAGGSPSLPTPRPDPTDVGPAGPSTCLRGRGEGPSGRVVTGSRRSRPARPPRLRPLGPTTRRGVARPSPGAAVAGPPPAAATGGASPTRLPDGAADSGTGPSHDGPGHGENIAHREGRRRGTRVAGHAPGGADVAARAAALGISCANHDSASVASSLT
jgi:hypothetical protein